MRRYLLALLISAALLFFSLYFLPESEIPKKFKHETKLQTIAGVVQKNETMDSIFSKYNLNKKELASILKASRNLYNLSNLTVGNIYMFITDEKKKSIQNMRYGIDTISYLDVARQSKDFLARKITLPQIVKTGTLYIDIEDNLIFSMPGNHPEYLKLALDLSEIYAWDIDFSSDIRNGDTVKIILEEFWTGEVFNGFGKILAAEFMNNGKAYAAYRFEYNGYADYFDQSGKSLKKSLLRSPVKFRYISSYFNRSRFHPILRIYRPHLGIDYAAPAGTPVSSAGNGTIMFAGYGGGIGNVVKIRHAGGFETSYGHLSKIQRNVRAGVKVSQGDIIGYVGSTGLSTGPHLDYRMRLNGNFINPLKVHLPRGESVPKNLITEFRATVNRFDTELSAISKPVIAITGQKGNEG
jgi:murein DD-endopeptidase MepM/ murein hydrolase activator NlpD